MSGNRNHADRPESSLPWSTPDVWIAGKLPAAGKRLTYAIIYFLPLTC